MSINNDPEKITLDDLVNARTVSAVIQAFFGSSQLSEEMQPRGGFVQRDHRTNRIALIADRRAVYCAPQNVVGVCSGKKQTCAQIVGAFFGTGGNTGVEKRHCAVIESNPKVRTLVALRVFVAGQ